MTSKIKGFGDAILGTDSKVAIGLPEKGDQSVSYKENLLVNKYKEMQDRDGIVVLKMFTWRIIW